MLWPCAHVFFIVTEKNQLLSWEDELEEELADSPEPAHQENDANRSTIVADWGRIWAGLREMREQDEIVRGQLVDCLQTVEQVLQNSGAFSDNSAERPPRDEPFRGPFTGHAESIRPAVHQPTRIYADVVHGGLMDWPPLQESAAGGCHASKECHVPAISWNVPFSAAISAPKKKHFDPSQAVADPAIAAPESVEILPSPRCHRVQVPEVATMPKGLDTIVVIDPIYGVISTMVGTKLISFDKELLLNNGSLDVPDFTVSEM